jgi:hypothetical protein
MKRPALPAAIEIEVLTKSARRCSLCHGLNKDFSEKQGQIAHLDKNSSNHTLANLVFLCLNHHDQYDGKSSQSKGYRSVEVKHYRQDLYKVVSEKLRREDLFQEEVDKSEQIYEAVSNLEYRFYSLENSLDVLEQQIQVRYKAVYEFIRRNNNWYDSQPCSLEEDDVFHQMYELQYEHLCDALGIPKGVYGLDFVGILHEDWLEELNSLIPAWVCGDCTYDDCTNIIYLLDECFDLDLHWILFGIPNSHLPRLAYRMLENFVYVFGMRGQSDQRANNLL